jgi:hypothetical protein
MQIELPLQIAVLDPPAGVAFAVQESRSGLLPPTQERDDRLVFAFAVRLGEQIKGEPPNFLGPFAQGPRNARFVYVNSGKRAGQEESTWDRRAKIALGGITWLMIKSAIYVTKGVIECWIEGSLPDGSPVCASVLPVREWQVIARH